MFRGLMGLCALLVAGLGAALADDGPKALFTDDAPLELTITGPMDVLARTMNVDEPETYEGLMTVHGGREEKLAITMKARGNFRRSRRFCRFPPLRVAFTDKPGEGSPFEKQKSLKLVTHCRDREAYAQYVHSEYLAYLLYNELTPVSLRVRMANITYVDDTDGKEYARQIGFFIEDIDDMAKRIGRKELDVPRVSPTALNPEAASRTALFQYMIGNLDWSMIAGNGEEECCHNATLVAEDKEVLEDIYPVAYDFDHSGLVDTAYAEPPERFGLNSVRDRRFRGFCTTNDETRRIAGEMVARKDAYLALVDTVPGMIDQRRKKARDYLLSFFRDIEDDARLERELLSTCRDIALIEP